MPCYIYCNFSMYVHVRTSPIPVFCCIGIPSTPGDITINTSCLSAITSWDQVTSNSICGPVSYDVTVLPSDGVAMMRITDTSYMYTNLKSDNNYTVTVAGRNNAGVGNSATGFFSVVGKHM